MGKVEEELKQKYEQVKTIEKQETDLDNWKTHVDVHVLDLEKRTINLEIHRWKGIYQT